MVQASGLMQGKRGVIMGVANNRSIAWGIAKAVHAQGGERAHSAEVAVRQFGQRRTGRLAAGTYEFDQFDVGQPLGFHPSNPPSVKAWHQERKPTDRRRMVSCGVRRGRPPHDVQGCDGRSPRFS